MRRMWADGYGPAFPFLTMGKIYKAREDYLEDESGSMAGENGDKEEERFRYYLSMLEEENPQSRWKAVESLARLGDTRAVDPIIGALGDEDWRVRQKAAWALGHLGDPRALVPLRHALMNEREGVKEMINEALDEIKRKMR